MKLEDALEHLFQGDVTPQAVSSEPNRYTLAKKVVIYDIAKHALSGILSEQGLGVVPKSNMSIDTAVDQAEGLFAKLWPEVAKALK